MKFPEKSVPLTGLGSVADVVSAAPELGQGACGRESHMVVCVSPTGHHVPGT